MADGLGGSGLVIFEDGSAEPQDQQAGIVPGVARTQVAIGGGGGEGELLPYNRKRIHAAVENPVGGGTIQIGLGDAFVTAADWTTELAAGDLYEIPDGYTGSVRCRNPTGAAVTVRVTEATVSVD